MERNSDWLKSRLWARKAACACHMLVIRPVMTCSATPMLFHEGSVLVASCNPECRQNAAQAQRPGMHYIPLSSHEQVRVFSRKFTALTRLS